jgi:hypothetical protein
MRAVPRRDARRVQLLKTARLTRATGETAAVTLIQRIGSALNVRSPIGFCRNVARTRAQLS